LSLERIVNIPMVLVAALLVPVLAQSAAAQMDDLDDLGDLDEESSQPAGESSQPADALSQPAGESSQPVGEAQQRDADGSSQPSGEAQQPADKPSQPAEKEAAKKADETPALTVKGYLKVQTGLFVPLISDGFDARENQAAEYMRVAGAIRPLNRTCDPVETPNRPCYALDHGQEAGSLSMGRGTLQLQIDWTLSQAVSLHTTSRGVRATELEADEWAQIVEIADDPADRRDVAKRWVLDNHYNEFDLFRTLYVDARAAEWLSFRIGRQFWSGTGKYQLLDVVNPKEETWHFGPLESFEETRTPLWMVTSQIDMSTINHSLELFWVPLIVVPVVDDERDTVTVPLSLVGAWGIPVTNTPSPFITTKKVFEYPGNRFEDMRAGVHWKGNLGSHLRYSLLYYYTHQQSPPIPAYYDYIHDDRTQTIDNTELERLILRFPRQHIAGMSWEFAFEGPVDKVTPPFGTPLGLVAKLEATVEPDKTYAVRTDSADSISGGGYLDPNLYYRNHFLPEELLVVNYGVSLTRPFLNPTVPVLLVGQFKHTLVPGYDEQDPKHAILVEIPGYDNYRVENSLMQVSFAVVAVTLKGFLVPKVIGALVLPDSGFYSLDLGINFSPSVGIHLVATDFFGENPYERLGLFRDRDEVNISLTGRF